MKYKADHLDPSQVMRVLTYAVLLGWGEGDNLLYTRDFIIGGGRGGRADRTPEFPVATSCKKGSLSRFGFFVPNCRYQLLHTFNSKSDDLSSISKVIRNLVNLNN